MSRLMTPREQFVVGFFGVAALIGSATALWLNREPEPLPELEELAAVAIPVTEVHAERRPTPAPEPEPSSIIVSVQGGVNAPGVYSMEANARIQELIRRAGGAAESGILDDINLAAKLIDGSTLTIPQREMPDVEDGVVTLRGKRNTPEVPNPPQYTLSGWASGAISDGGEGPTASPPHASNPVVAADGRIDLNTATAGELEQLPGVGPVLAQSIIEHRSNSPFATVEQLQDVRGIGPKRYETLRELVTVGR